PDINEIKIDSVVVPPNPACNNVDAILFSAEKMILQSSLFLFANTPNGGTIRMKKYICYNATTFQNCDTSCYFTDYTITKHNNNDSLWYEIDLSTNSPSNMACGVIGNECFNKSSVFIPPTTVLASQPAGPPDSECEDKCFWKLTGNVLPNDFEDQNVIIPFYMGTRNAKDVVFKRNEIEKMRIGTEGLGIGQKKPVETLHVGEFFTFHTGANFYSLGFNDYYDAGLRKRWENKFSGSTEKQFSGALTFYSSQYNGDGAIELGTAGLGNKNETLNYTESNNLAGHNLGFKGLVIRPTPLSTTNNYGLIGLGTFPNEDYTRVLIKGMGNDNLSAALNVTNNAGNSKLIVKDDGRIGINQMIPTSLMHLKGLGNTTTSSLNIVNSDNNPLLFVQDNGNVGIGVSTDLTTKLTVNGKVRIGTSNVLQNSAYLNTYKLLVDGDIIAPRVVVSTTDWADFVFDKNYKLATLEEVESHINENKHLKGIPTESEVKNNGVDIGAMNVKLLQKVEELTLYMIQLKKESDRLSRENKEIYEKLNKIKRK
ncbi:MAG: hypothetical protein NTW25_03020, partial [Candidatus Kapabacteria bacterium]|nr:hypothetical protein [Candidatus Kapabacteria bacterium]